jgi:DNA-binding NarL/FixJ family response regulator
VGNTVRIILVDDHPMMRDGLRFTIHAQPDMQVVAEAGNGVAALEMVKLHKPDLVLMDISMPGDNGLEVSRRLRSEFPDIKIIIMSGLADEDYVSQAIKSSLNGYLLKANAPQELISAIRAVMSGHTFLSPEITTAVMGVYKGLIHEKESASQSLLSARELQVLKLIAEGLRAKEIADRLNIGVKTVDTYRARLMTKLNCGSTAELVRYAIREKIVSN